MADFDILGKILAESQFLKACRKGIQGNWVAFINAFSDKWMCNQAVVLLELKIRTISWPVAVTFCSL